MTLSSAFNALYGMKSFPEDCYCLYQKCARESSDCFQKYLVSQRRNSKLRHNVKDRHFPKLSQPHALQQRFTSREYLKYAAHL